MSPEDLKLITLAGIFVKHFPPQVVTEFREHIKIGETFIAECVFNPAWRKIKDELFRRKVPYTKNEVIIFLNSVLGMESEISEVWNSILFNDPDFLYLERMNTDQQLGKIYQETEDEEEKEVMNREESLKYLIRQVFLRTAQQSPGQIDRIEWAFYEELKILLDYLTKRQIATNPEELIKILRRELPVLRTQSSNHILHGVYRYAHVLDMIKPRKIKREEFSIKIDKAKLLAELEAEWQEAEEIEARVTAEAQPMDIMEIRQRDFSADHSKEIFDVTTLEINAKGIKEAMESIIFNFGPDEFFERIKIMHEKIKIHCRDKNLLEPLIKIVFKLKSGYERNFEKSLEILSNRADKLTSDKSGLDLKLKYIISALGVFWAFLEEAVRIEKTTNGNGKH